MKLPFPNLSTPNRSSIALTSFRRTNFASKFDCIPYLIYVSPNPQFTKRLQFITLCCSNNPPNTTTTQFPKNGRSNPRNNSISRENEKGNQWKSEVRNPVVPRYGSFSLREHAFLLLAFLASMTTIAFISLVAAAVPTLYAMRRAAISFAELVDTANLELPNTLAAIRLSSMEISDLTLELNDLKQDISEGATKSAQESAAGAKQIGAVAYRQTISTVNEKANLPIVSLQTVVFGARKKSSPL